MLYSNLNRFSQPCGKTFGFSGRENMILRQLLAPHRHSFFTLVSPFEADTSTDRGCSNEKETSEREFSFLIFLKSPLIYCYS